MDVAAAVDSDPDNDDDAMDPVAMILSHMNPVWSSGAKTALSMAEWLYTHTDDILIYPRLA